MPKYLIERNIQSIGHSSEAELQMASQKSCDILHQLGTQIQWLQSYVTSDKLYCVYIAPDEKLIEQHAQASGFPAHRISKIQTVIDPTTAEA